jgi:hypothetical protein
MQLEGTKMDELPESKSDKDVDEASDLLSGLKKLTTQLHKFFSGNGKNSQELINRGWSPFSGYFSGKSNIVEETVERKDEQPSGNGK